MYSVDPLQRDFSGEESNQVRKWNFYCIISIVFTLKILSIKGRERERVRVREKNQIMSTNIYWSNWEIISAWNKYYSFDVTAIFFFFEIKVTMLTWIFHHLLNFWVHCVHRFHLKFKEITLNSYISSNHIWAMIFEQD